MNITFPLFWPGGLYLVCFFLLASFSTRAQVSETVPPQLVENTPAHGTFYLLGQIPSAPYPFDPYHGTLPVYAYDGVYFVDNTGEFFFEGEGGGMMMSSMSGPTPPSFGGTNSSSTNLCCNGLTNFTVSYLATNALTLGIAQTTNPWIALTIRPTTTNASYDMFGTTNLVELAMPFLSRTNWAWLTRARGSTTNFSWGETNWCERYFQLGTMQDADNDGLTDAYENLASHTATNTANSPRTIYEAVIASQNPSNWFKLNDGSLTNAISGQAALTSTGIWDVDAFATGNNAIEFNGSSQRLTAGDVINGGTGTSQGSLSLLFRSLPSHPTNNLTTPRYVFSQRGNITNELGLFFQPTNAASDSGSLKLQIGGQTNILLTSNAIVFGTWYYLALTWNESNQLATWYLAPIGGTLSSSNFNFGATNVVGNSSNVVFGNRQNAGGNYTNAFRIPPGNGALDQIVFWNRELTSAEVKAQFHTLDALFQGPAKTFDLSRWNILLPINSDGQLNGTAPLEISTGWLNSGFKYVDPTDWTQKYFYLSNGNQMVFEAPWNGAKTSSSSGARSELRGTNPDGSKDNWFPLGTNTLEATCVVHGAGTNNDRKIIIGQFHSETASGGPPVVISYNFPSLKNVTATYKNSPTSSADNNFTLATNVNLLDQIHYQVRLTGDGTNINLHGQVSINGVLQTPTLSIPMASSPTNAWHTNTFYFKAGCYYPTNGSGSPAAGTAKATFSSLRASHQP